MPQLRQMLADQGVRLSDWRLKETSADAQQLAGGDAAGQQGDRADGSRADGGSSRPFADTAGNPAPGFDGGDSRSRAQAPANRWGAMAAPLAGAAPPGVGPHAAASERRLDLYA